MSLSIPVPLALGRFKRLPQRGQEVWQGGIVRLPTWVDHPTDPDGPPFRPTGVLWVSLRTGLVHLDLLKDGASATAAVALDAFLEFGLKSARGLEGRPVRVEVADAGLREALAGPLAALSTTIDLVDDLPAVREALRNFEAQALGEPFAGLLESPGMSVERLRAFAAAAAAFFTADPWNHLANEDLIVVEGDRAPRTMRHLCVLGHGGQEFGLAFFDSRQAFERLLDRADSGHHSSRAHGVTYGAVHELPFADVDAWEDHALPVAGPLAYPLAADLRRDGTIRRPDALALTHAEALLRALAETTDEELDSGRWHRRVDTFDGPVDLTFTLPLLLEAEASPLAQQGLRVAAELEQRQGSDELPEPAGAPPGGELTALERAQELAYDAMDSDGRLRSKRARQALAISPDCTDARVILAEEAPTPEAAIEHYERAVLAGARAIGAEHFESLRGEFWGHLETRPYMRARLGLAQALREVARHDDALAHYRELLRLNPVDNQGVRYLLLVALLELDRNEEAGAVLAGHEDDIQALWPYGRMLWHLRVHGDAPDTRAACQAAFAANPHVVPYLLDPESLPLARPPHFALGSRDEAAYVAEMLDMAFMMTPGATEWLQAQPRRSRPRKRRR